MAARPTSVSTETLLEVACEMFLEHGPSVSTARIARAAGISEAVLFKRFGTKANLLHSALHASVEGLAPVLAVPFATPFDLAAHLERIGEAVAGLLRAVIPRMMMLRSAGDYDPYICFGKEQEPPPKILLDQLAAHFGHLMDAGHMLCGDSVVCARLFMGSFQNLAFFEFIDSVRGIENDAPTMVPPIVAALINGFAPVDSADV